MTMIRLYVYVDGSDLDDAAPALCRAFEEFAASWGVPSTRLVNDKYERTPDLPPGYLPDWNLGLNAEIERLPRDKIEALIQFLSSTARETDRKFIVGTWNPNTKISEDWCFVGPDVKPGTVDFLAGQLQ